MSATEVESGQTVELEYVVLSECGHGSFGVVRKCQLRGPVGGGGVVALKRTKQERKFKVGFLAFWFVGIAFWEEVARGLYAGEGMSEWGGQVLIDFLFLCFAFYVVPRFTQNRELQIMQQVS